MIRTRVISILILIFAAALPLAAQQQRPGGVPGGAQTDAQITAALETYRKAWQSMTPPQRNAMIQSGGLTPEQYEEVLRSGKTAALNADDSGAPRRSGLASAAQELNRPADSGALDSLRNSLRDLDSIRDANVERVQKDVCPPEMGARIAVLRAQLQRQDAELKGEIPATLPRSRTAVNPLDTASNWSKTAEVESSESGTAKDRLLNSVLPGSNEKVETRAENAQSDPAVRRKTIEQEIASAKAELEHLLGACTAAKR